MTCSEATCRCAKFTIKAICSSVGLCAMVVAYVLLGGYLFRLIEGNKELADLKAEEQRKEAQRGIVILNLTSYFNRTFSLCSSAPSKSTEMTKRSVADSNGCVRSMIVSPAFDTLLQDLLDRYDKQVFSEGMPASESNDSNVKLQWTLGNAVLFSTTVITTIGYGNLVPKTKLGRFMCMVYALFGVPLMLITLASMGNFMATCFRFTYQRCCYPITSYWMNLCQPRYKINRRRQGNRNSRIPNTLRLSNYQSGSTEEDTIDDVVTPPPTPRKPREIPIYLSLLVLISYLVGVSIMFMYWENWAAMDAIYFCFITFSTIGFGDLVPGDSITSQAEENSYKSALCAVSVLFGLAIMSMCFNLMQDTIVSYFRSCCRRVRGVGEFGTTADNIIPGNRSGTVTQSLGFDDSVTYNATYDTSTHNRAGQKRPNRKNMRQSPK